MKAALRLLQNSFQGLAPQRERSPQLGDRPETAGTTGPRMRPGGVGPPGRL